MKSNASSEVIELILKVGAVPSFSYCEDRLHPLIRELVADIPGVEIIPVAEHNLIVTIPGASGCPSVALSAHLDKNDHYGTGDKPLAAFVRGNKIVGPMDDSAGLGICLAVARATTRFQFPPLMLLFSEQEECGGAGARRISEYILNHQLLPSEVITLDTTPRFRGESGLALYCEPWSCSGHRASTQLKKRTSSLRESFLDIAPNLVVMNNHNDYVTYGEALNPSDENPVPSIAIEPSIYPYHQEREEVFIDDILLLETILQTFLSNQVKTGK